MHTLCGTVLRTSSPRIRNYADSDGGIGTGGNFQLSHAHSYGAKHNNRNYMTAVMYQATSLMCSFIYGMGLQPTDINQLVTPNILYFSTCDP